MDFGGAKAEIEHGLIYMMTGGNEVHARIAANLVAYLHAKLRGTGGRAYGSDFAIRTGERSMRFPSVSIYCNNPSGPGNDRKKVLGDPRVVFEVLSPSTSSYDQTVRLQEYRDLEPSRSSSSSRPTNAFASFDVTRAAAGPMADSLRRLTSILSRATLPSSCRDLLAELTCVIWSRSAWPPLPRRSDPALAIPPMRYG